MPCNEYEKALAAVKELCEALKTSEAREEFWRNHYQELAANVSDWHWGEFIIGALSASPFAALLGCFLPRLH